MNAEDIREGMWLTAWGMTFRATHRPNASAWHIVYMDGSIEDLSAQPWTPRVGDWVHNLEGTAAQVVAFHPRTDTHAATVDLGPPSGCRWCASDVEPCAPPEAKPVTFTVTPDAMPYVYSMEELERAVSVHAVKRVRIAEDHAPIGNAEVARTHTATAECVEPVCDDPRTRMPDAVTQTRTRRNETVWIAIGRERAVRHPTEAGAIAAWREAVNRGKP